MTQDENRYLPPADENPARQDPGGAQRPDAWGSQTWDRRESASGEADDQNREDQARSDEIPFELDNPEVTSVDGNLDDPEQFPGVEYNPLGFVRVDTNKEDARPGRQTGSDRRDDKPVEELNIDFITVGTDAEAVMADIDDYTDDQEVLADFAERQEVTNGSDELLNRLREHTSQSPNLSGDDIDAAWDRSDQSGEESVGGSAPTPDQDIVEELGEAVGILYEDNEPLNTEEKLRQRDQNRWELDPASAGELDLENESGDRFAALQGAELPEDVEEIDLVDYLKEIDESKDGEDEDEDEGYDDELDDLDDDFLLGGLDDEHY